MYKDVGKRVLAIAVAICLVVTLVNIPGIEVKADPAKVYHDYMYGENGDAGYVAANTAAAIFKADRNDSGGAELLSGVSFDVHAENGEAFAGASANVSVYAGPVSGDPESGVFLCSNESYSLVEGTNELSFGASSAKLNNGEFYAVVVTLNGDGLSFYTDSFSETGCTYIKTEDGSWKDMGTEEKSVTIRTTTYDEPFLDPIKESIVERVTDFVSNLMAPQEVSLTITREEEFAEEVSAENPSEEESTDAAAEGDETPVTEDELIWEEGATFDIGIDGEKKEGEANVNIGETAGTDANNPAAPTDTSGGGQKTIALNVSELTLAENYTFTLKATNLQANRVYEWKIADSSPADAVGFVGADGTISSSAEGDAVTVKALKANANVIQVDVREYEIIPPVPPLTKPTRRLTGVGGCKITVVEKFLEVSLDSIDDVTYTGSEQKAKVVVREKESGKIIPDTSNAYSVNYNGDLVNAGTIEVTVTGNNTGYTGSDTKTYRILPKAIDETFINGEIAIENVGTLTQEGIENIIADKILYNAVNPDGTTTPVLLTKNTDYSLVNWEADFAEAGEHKVTMVALEGGNYTGSIEITYSIRKSIADTQNADVIVAPGNFNGAYTYTGEEIIPSVTVKYAGKVLKPDEDYTIEFLDNTNAGSATIHIVGINDYCGEVEKNFDIAPKYISNYDMSLFSVDVLPIEFPVAARPDSADDPIPVPEYTVSYRGNDLVKGTDYTESEVRITAGTNVLDATKAEITITGNGNFTGERTLVFNVGTDIQKYIDDNGFVIDLGIQQPYIYTGQVVSLENVTIGDLVQNVDFTVECQSRDVGTANVYIRGIGAYGGVYHMNGDPALPSATFEIAARDLSQMDDACFVLPTKRVDYSKDPEKMKPEVSVVFMGNSIDPAEYIVEYDAVLAVGTHSIKIKANSSNLTGEKTIQYEIVRVNLTKNNTTVELPEDYRYTGKPIDIRKDAVIKCNGETLEIGVDYEIIYVTDGESEDDYQTGIGTKNIEIHGINNYTGIVEASYVVSRIPLNEVEIVMDQLDADASSYVQDLLGGETGYRAYLRYDGTKKEPQVVLNYCDENGAVVTTLQQDVDYTVTYRNNTEMSKEGEPAYLVITAKKTDKAACVGELIIPFLIYREIDNAKIDGVPDSVVFTGSEMDFSDEVSVKTEEKNGILTSEKELILNYDYFITYVGDNINAGDNKVVEIHGRPKADILTPNGCYVINYSKQYSIGKRPLSTVEYDELVKQYDNAAVKLTEEDFAKLNPGFYLVEGGERVPLVYGEDYTVVESSYDGNNAITDGATASVQITAKDPGNFTGTKRIYFSIAGKSIMTVDVEAESIVYNVDRVEKVPKLTITDGNYTLQPDIDYVIVPKRNEIYVDAGDAYVYIKGIGNYEGEEERKIRYQILPLDISDTTLGAITLNGMEAEYTWEPNGVKPVPTAVLYRPDGAQADTRLNETDYEILPYVAFENVGEHAMIQIQGVGNFSGVYTQEYKINPKDLSIPDDEDIVIEDIPDQEFSGSYATYVSPDVVVKHKGVTLVKDRDYKLTYKNNFGVTGRPATATIHGIGNYEGTVSKQFNIINSMNDGSTIKVTYNDPDDEYLYTGDVIKPSVTVRNTMTGVKLVEGTDYTIEVPKGFDNTNVGPARIVVTGKGKYSGQIPHDFTILPRSIKDPNVEITLPDGYQYEYTGEHIAPKVEVSFMGKTMSSNDFEIVTPDRYIEVGTGKVVIKGVGNFGAGEETVEVSFDIVPMSIGSSNNFAPGFSGVISDQDYTGSALEPQPIITYKNKTLTLDTDYTLSDYTNNIDIGVATVKVNGIGNYRDSVTLAFAIKGKINNSNIEITLPETTYHAIPDPSATTAIKLKEIKPEPTVTFKYDDGRSLELSAVTDYNVKYRNNARVGEAEVYIEGKGAYEGTASTTFRIIGDLKDAVVEPIPPQPYDDGEIITPEVVVKYYGMELVAETDYECISTSKDITPDGSTEVLTIQGVAGGYFDGTSTTAEFRIVEAIGLIVKVEDPHSYTFTGSQIKPKIRVRYDGIKLEENQYTVNYGTNINAGSLAGVVRVTYRPNGQSAPVVEEARFTINKFNLEQVGVTVKDNDEYGHIRDMEYLGGNPIVPNNYEVVLQTDGVDVLSFGSDKFTLTFPEGDNINPGVAHARIVANTANENNFTGSIDTTFRIVARDMANTNIMVDQKDYIYNGTKILPEVTIIGHANAKNGIDYIIRAESEDGCVNAGVQRAVVEGISSYYTGSQVVEFIITPLGMDSADITIDEIPAQAFTGSEVHPDDSIVVRYKGIALTADVDYNVTYENCINAGNNTAVARIVGKGNFNSSKTKNFTINPVDINSESIVLEPIPSGIYTGSPVEAVVTMKFGEMKLTQGVDFTVEYDGPHTELGVVNLTIIGKDNFVGRRSGSFRIVADSIANAEVEGLELSYVYTGKAICPDNLKVSIGTTVLTKDTDYTLSYGENTNVGNGTVTISGTGETYGGSKELTFQITQKSISDADVVMTGFVKSIPYNGLPVVQDGIVLTYGDMTLTEGTDYVLECTNNNAVTDEARMTISGIGNFAGTISETYIISAAAFDNIEVSNVSSVYTYTGEPIVPEPIVTVDGAVLTVDVDYTVELKDNVNAGVATLIINGIGNFKGAVKEVNFTILSRSIQRATFAPIEDQIYNGEEVRPDVTVTDKDKVLVAGIDYDLSYTENQKAGTATAIIVGKKNYRATKYLQFEIKVGAVTSATVTEWTDTTVSLSWSGEGVVTGYEIYRDDGSGQYQLIARTAKQSYTDTQLTSGTFYSYRVRAYYLATDSEPAYGEISPTVEIQTR